MPGVVGWRGAGSGRVTGAGGVGGVGGGGGGSGSGGVAGIGWFCRGGMPARRVRSASSGDSCGMLFFSGGGGCG